MRYVSYNMHHRRRITRQKKKIANFSNCYNETDHQQLMQMQKERNESSKFIANLPNLNDRIQWKETNDANIRTYRPYTHADDWRLNMTMIAMQIETQNTQFIQCLYHVSMHAKPQWAILSKIRNSKRIKFVWFKIRIRLKIATEHRYSSKHGCYNSVTKWQNMKSIRR